MLKKIKILFAVSELTPVAKVGGLGDVASSLPKALKGLNCDIRVVIPYYEVIKEKGLSVELVAKGLKVKAGNKEEKINIYQSAIPQSNVILYLLENDNYLSQGEIYFAKSAFCGSFKEIKRFLFFSQSVLEIFKPLNWRPDIIHCQDWHTAIIALLLKTAQSSDWVPRRMTGQKSSSYSTTGGKKSQGIKTLFTIHNLANQGQWNAKEILDFLNLKEEDWPTLKEQPLGPYGKNINLIQQGILNADLINTVSPSYAKEILTEEYGEGLEETLLKRKKALSGILNGIDVEVFNPETDPHLKTNYSLKSLDQRIENKLDLQKTVNLPVDKNIPLIGFIGRLTSQKGLDLIYPIIEHIIKLLEQPRTLCGLGKVQIIFLGAGGEKYEKMFRDFKKRYPKNISSNLGFNAALAQKIYAGADILLVPSRFEPCGLIQMIGMRYGAVPLVRETGGLKDTVEKSKIKNQKSKIMEGTGFVFKEYDSQKLFDAIKEALVAYKDKKIWRQIQINGMKKDFSWHKSAKEYMKLYNRLI